jgi:gamma-glutamyl hercynylcysteine S-oxide synthase
LRENLRHPASWCRCGSSESPTGVAAFSTWQILTVDGLVGMSQALDWPVYTSLAEARAYANFVGAELPSEAQWDRAAYGDTSSPDAHPWPGRTADSGIHGNFGFHRRGPMPVGSFLDGKSWVGVLDMVGNGWELTNTAFAPLPGFEQMELYPQYSIDFFDGKHYVLKGASWATHTCMVRRTFRNFYQAHYPYVFSKFRLVKRNDSSPRF